MAYGYYPNYQQPSVFNQQGAVPDALSQLKNPYQTQTNTGLLWVQGENAAKAWMVAPGNTLALWDTEAPMIYVKSVDPSGLPTIKKYRWEEVSAEPENHSCKCSDKFISKEEFSELKTSVNEIAKKLEDLTKEEIGHA